MHNYELWWRGTKFRMKNYLYILKTDINRNTVWKVLCIGKEFIFTDHGSKKDLENFLIQTIFLRKKYFVYTAPWIVYYFNSNFNI